MLTTIHEPGMMPPKSPSAAASDTSRPTEDAQPEDWMFRETPIMRYDGLIS